MYPKSTPSESEGNKTPALNGTKLRVETDDAKRGRHRDVEIFLNEFPPDALIFIVEFCPSTQHALHFS
jgi:hypothetical protein